MTDRDPAREAWERWALAATVVAVVAVFWPALGGQALDWDDPVWLEDLWLDDLTVPRPLGLGEAAAAAFGTYRDGVYAPVLRVTFWAILGATGGSVAAIHAATLAAYAASVVGVHAVARRLGVGAVPAWVAVTLWALHPTKVEVVAWATGLKDAASLGWLVAMAVVLVGRSPTPGRVAAGTALGVAGLLTKAAVLPVASTPLRAHEPAGASAGGGGGVARGGG
ncbi:MAG: hypothetical protein ABMB14_38595, partial [Myxococcota bacterium]